MNSGDKRLTDEKSGDKFSAVAPALLDFANPPIPLMLLLLLLLLNVASRLRLASPNIEEDGDEALGFKTSPKRGGCFLRRTNGDAGKVLVYGLGLGPEGEYICTNKHWIPII